MNVKLTRRWGQHAAGKSVDVDEAQAEWLVRHNYAESTGDLQAPEQEAVAPGANGPDPLAGGDGSRLRMQTVKQDHGDRNRALLAEGAPPAYRAGYTSEDRKREGEAGRNFRKGSDERAGVSTAAEGSPEADRQGARVAAAQERTSDEAASTPKRAARSRKSSES